MRRRSGGTTVVADDTQRDGVRHGHRDDDLSFGVPQDAVYSGFELEQLVCEGLLDATFASAPSGAASAGRR